MANGSSWYPKFQMSSNVPTETSSQIPQEPARNLPFQMYQCPIVIPRSPMQSSLLVPERDLCQQQSPGLSRKSSIRMQPDSEMGLGLSTLRKFSGRPSHLIPSRTSVRSGFHVRIRPTALSAKQTGHMAPRKLRKERILYSKKQKRLLQEHFEKCQSPNREQRVELALLVGVTEKDIQVCLSLFSQSNSNNAPFPIRHLNYVLLKFLGQCSLIYFVDIHASNAGPHILHQPDTNRDEHYSPSGSQRLLHQRSY